MAKLMTSISQAYGLFPTYNNFFQQVMEQNRFAEDPLVTKSQLPTSEIETLKQKVKELEKLSRKLNKLFKNNLRRPTIWQQIMTLSYLQKI